jgi:hypothetical protein
MNLRKWIANRTLGTIGILGLFALQSAYEFFFCGGGLFGFWEITLTLVSAPALLLLTGSRAALISCAVLVPFILFANAAECAPYQGGGAAMGYVPALIFGMPLSFFIGSVAALVFFLQGRQRTNSG